MLKVIIYLILSLVITKSLGEVKDAPPDMFNKEIVTRLFSFLTTPCQQELERFILKHIPFGPTCQVEIAKSLEVMKVPIERDVAPKPQLTDEQQLLGMKYFLAFSAIFILVLVILSCCCCRYIRSRKALTKQT